MATDYNRRNNGAEGAEKMKPDPGEAMRRERFAHGLVTLAAECQLATDELADSLLTILIGIFLRENIPEAVFVERVKHAWKECERVIRHPWFWRGK